MPTYEPTHKKHKHTLWASQNEVITRTMRSKGDEVTKLDNSIMSFVISILFQIPEPNEEGSNKEER
jgi:hypothetical protein